MMKKMEKPVILSETALVACLAKKNNIAIGVGGGSYGSLGAIVGAAWCLIPAAAAGLGVSVAV
jgi:hypothetical protein